MLNIKKFAFKLKKSKIVKKNKIKKTAMKLLNISFFVISLINSMLFFNVLSMENNKEKNNLNDRKLTVIQALKKINSHNPCKNPKKPDEFERLAVIVAIYKLELFIENSNIFSSEQNEFTNIFDFILTSFTANEKKNIIKRFNYYESILNPILKTKISHEKLGTINAFDQNERTTGSIVIARLLNYVIAVDNLEVIKNTKELGRRTRYFLKEEDKNDFIKRIQFYDEIFPFLDIKKDILE